MIAQGLFLSSPPTRWPALLFATAGGVLQAAFSLFVWVVADRDAKRREGAGWNTRAAMADFAANFTLRSTSFRHGLRFGAALAAGVAVYRLLDMEEHGFWIP